jgi:hypothetical protein
VKYLFVIITILLSSNSFSETWKFQTRSNGKGVVIFGEGEINSLSEAFAKGEVTHLTMRRIADIQSETLQTDIHQYFQLNFPNEYNAAIKSSGNMHNPAIHPLRKLFKKALLSSRYFVNLNKKIVNSGYTIVEISYEKFRLVKSNGVVFFDAYTWVSVENSPNKKINKD